MDLKDKLAQLDKQRAVHRRGREPARPERRDKVHDAWQKIDSEESLTVKQKLERLISLTGPKPGRAEAVRGRTGLRAPLPAPDPFQVFENSYDLSVRYGRTRISQGLEVKGEILSLLGRSEEFGGLDLSTALFLDLETTGLAGGTGTVPFLVGLGFYREGRFRVVQYFLHDIGAEEEMLDDLSRFFRETGFRSVVSYNGRAFDLPLLETRFVLKRRPFDLSELPHLDFLFPARVLWRHKHDNCRLCHLAREVVQTGRSEDIPSAEIPLRYFEYLRSRDFSLIEPILYHNQEDILSLLALVVSGAELVEMGAAEELPEEMDGMDLYGVGRMFERVKRSGESVRVFERAVGGRLSSEVALQTRLRLSRHFKKQGRHREAAVIWQELVAGSRAASARELAVYRELAVHYERREKDIERAMRFAEEGLALSKGVSPGLHEDFSRRLKRLRAASRGPAGGGKRK